MHPLDRTAADRTAVKGAIERLPLVVFVRGCARSGTTLLADLMNEHERMGVLVEQPLGDLAARMAGILWFEEHAKRERAKIEEGQRSAARPKRGRAHYLPYENLDRMRTTLRYPTRERFPEIVAAAVAATFGKPHLRVIGSKTPGRWEYWQLDLVRSLYPRVKCVFAVRNPLATINSIISRRNAAREGRDSWPKESIREAIARYQENVALLLSTAAASPRDCYVVAHEDLLADPGTTLHGLGEFLDETLRDESGLIGKPAPSHDVLSSDEARLVHEQFGGAIASWSSKALTGRPVGLACKLADCVRRVTLRRSENERVLVARDRGMLGAGWSGSEPGGVWSEAPQSDLFFAVAHEGTYRVHLRFSGYIPTIGETLTFSVALGEQRSAVTVRNGWLRRLALAPEHLAAGVAHRIRFDFGDLRSPAERGRGDDRRYLGIKLREVTFERVD